MRKIFLVYIMVIATLVISIKSVLANDLSVVISQSVLGENNAHSTPKERESEVALDSNLKVSWKGQSKNIDAFADYSMSYLEYTRDHFDNTRSVEGSSGATFKTHSGRVNWMVSDTESYSVVDKRLADNDDNRAQKSTLKTGPELIFAFSPVDELALNLDYTRAKLSSSNESGSDNESKIKRASISWQHQLSSIRDFSISLSKEKTEFGNAENDASTLGFFAKLNVVTASGKFSAGVGFDGLDQESGSKSTSNSFELDYTKDWSASNVGLKIGKELADTVEVSDISENNKFEDKSIRTNADFDFKTSFYLPTYTFTVGLGYVKDELQSEDNVETVYSYEVGFQNQVSSHLTLLSGYTVERIKFDSSETNRVDLEHEFTIGSEYSISSRMTLSANANISRRQFGKEDGKDEVDINNSELILSIVYRVR